MFRMLQPLIRPVLAFAAVALLSGCVAYPAGYYGGYGGGYYAPAPVVVPAYPAYGRGGWGRWR